MKTESAKTWNRFARRLVAGGRTFTVVIALALAVGAAGPVDAGLIDDFSQPIPDPIPGNGINFAVVDGQLVINGTWEGSYIQYEQARWDEGFVVADGATLELRAELVSAVGTNVFVMLALRGGAGEGGYSLLKDDDEIGLMKTYDANHHTLLFHTNALIKHENVILVLRATPMDDALMLQARVLDKTANGLVLWESTAFVDGPQSDFGIPDPFPFGFPFEADRGAPMGWTDRVGLGLLHFETGPARYGEIIVDNLEYSLYPAPELAIEKSVLLSWPANTAEEQIVLTAESLTGPWIPCLEPIFKRNDCLCVAVPTTSAQQYFKPAPGSQLSDDFSNPTRQWWECFPDPQPFQVDRVDGVLRISKPATGGNYNRGVLGAVPLAEIESYLHADFAMSVDILEWTTNLMATGAEQQIGFIARGTPTPIDCSPGIFSTYSYMGLFRLRENSPATVTIYAYPPNEDLVSQDVTLNPEKAYRLVFCGSGSELTLRLFDLENLAVPEVSLQVTDTTLTQGIPGLWLNSGNGGAYDITIDNYGVRGTKP